MQIRKATTQDLECVRELTRETICQIYPKYYPAGAVQFFLNHHCDGKISADIRQGCVYLAEDPADGIVGTVTVKADEKQIVNLHCNLKHSFSVSFDGKTCSLSEGYCNWAFGQSGY